MSQNRPPFPSTSGAPAGQRGASTTIESIRRRSGDAKAEALKLTEQTGELLVKSVKEARRLGGRREAHGAGAAHRRSSRLPASSTSWPIEGRRADHLASPPRTRRKAG